MRKLTDPGLDDHERKFLTNIEQYGLSITHVLPEGNSPGWSFSAGLYPRYGHPEIVVFGLNRDVAHWLVNHAADEIREGRPFVPGAEYEGLLEGVRCTFRPVASVWYDPFLGWARWYHGGDEFPVLQCIWPDHDGHYPWDDGFPEAWKCAQPLLFHSGAREARAEALLASVEEPRG